MKCKLIILLLLGISNSLFSQTKMFINRTNGSTDSLLLSEVKSITFKIYSLQEMIRVVGGTFQMGSSSGESDEQPAHSVTLSSYYIDKYHVTYEKWNEIRDWASTHGYTDLPLGGNGSNAVGPNNPETMVNWFDVVKWCNARSEKEGLIPVYYTDTTKTIIYRTGNLSLSANDVDWGGNGYRLPTEAEYEFAARGGNNSNGYIYSGSDTVGNVAWYDLNSGTSTHTVGTRAPNELGIYDMSGNVWEWCWDWHGTYPSASQSNPKGSGSGTDRVLRGGSFYYPDSRCRVAGRGSGNPGYYHYSFGFRCVKL